MYGRTCVMPCLALGCHISLHVEDVSSVVHGVVCRLRMGMCHGCPRAIVPDHMGRADYHGASINSAARYMDAAAHGGMVVCEEETAKRIIDTWNKAMCATVQQLPAMLANASTATTPQGPVTALTLCTEAAGTAAGDVVITDAAMVTEDIGLAFATNDTSQRAGSGQPDTPIMRGGGRRDIAPPASTSAPSADASTQTDRKSATSATTDAPDADGAATASVATVSRRSTNPGDSHASHASHASTNGGRELSEGESEAVYERQSGAAARPPGPLGTSLVWHENPAKDLQAPELRQSEGTGLVVGLMDLSQVRAHQVTNAYTAYRIMNDCLPHVQSCSNIHGMRQCLV